MTTATMQDEFRALVQRMGVHEALCQIAGHCLTRAEGKAGPITIPRRRQYHKTAAALHRLLAGEGTA